jgi:hypothetical protein
MPETPEQKQHRLFQLTLGTMRELVSLRRQVAEKELEIVKLSQQVRHELEAVA